MIRKLKAYYNKIGFDYSTGYVDPFEYHSTFYFFLKAFQVTDSGGNKNIRFPCQNAFIFITGLVATLIVFMSLCNGLSILEIPDITEAGTYTIILLYELLILSCTKLNASQYHNLLKAMQEDFQYICSDGKKYRERFFKSQLTTWKVSIIAIFFTFSIGVGMLAFAIAALIYYLATHKPEDSGKRPLLFPFWAFDVDFGASPVYEIAFMFSNICIIAYPYNYVFMIQTQIVWVRHISTKADIVIWSIYDLLEDLPPATNEEEKEYFSKLIKQRMRQIIIHHQSMYSLLEDYSKVYKKLLMYEQKCCGPVVCLTAYCTAEKLDEGDLNLILILLFIAAIVLCFVPSYLCTFLAIKVSSICDACWGIQFWIAGPVVRPYLVLIMQRSLRRLPFQASGFEEVSVQTFANKMSSAYSCFNMLRQANRK